MPEPIGRDDLRRLIGDDAQVAEVLGRAEYERAHIHGAMHLPLEELSPELAADRLHAHRPVIVYYNN